MGSHDTGSSKSKLLHGDNAAVEHTLFQAPATIIIALDISSLNKKKKVMGTRGRRRANDGFQGLSDLSALAQSE